MAQVVLINKEGTADPADIERLVGNIRSVNPGATIIHASSPVTFDEEVYGVSVANFGLNTTGGQGGSTM